MSRASLSLVGAAALLASVSVASAAQKGHGGGGGHMPAHAPMPHIERPAKMDHESAKGEAHEARRAEDAHKVDMAQGAKSEDHAQRLAVNEARNQSSHLLKGVKLTPAERRRVKDIDKKYDAQLKALRKDEKAADKAGGTDSDAAYEAKVAALAAQERADIRATLPVAQQARYDANVLSRASAKH